MKHYVNPQRINEINWGRKYFIILSILFVLGLGLLGTTAALSGVMGVTLTMAIGGADMPGNITFLFVTVVVTVRVTCCSVSKDSLVVVVKEKLRDQCEGELSRKVTSSLNISFGSGDPIS